ncbi:YggS family pyridoxal phosphate-dependent enzyme [Dokdonella sp.]|uniref:YggS family pyridoxal phosphate-dependent enzyme n=1 Tax=Dokdonella sp. TaxID=2291710 RepID=UPI0035283C36
MIAAWRSVIERAQAAAAGRSIEVLAVSKTRPAQQIRTLAEAGQRAFGENYVQEARGKQTGLSDCSIEWHLVGPLQSNKCADVAGHFDWLQTLDRSKLVALLARYRPESMPPLNVLIQVNIDDESSKAGCNPEEIATLAHAVGKEPRLRLRGLMAIPAPATDMALRRKAFSRMRACFETLARQHAGIDTLSMGMSDDFELAIAEGATMVRVGSLLFGPRGRE